ncbi:MAG: beta-L-arabinofuranosidase domain-containing protein [Bacteroidota bacterium]
MRIRTIAIVFATCSIFSCRNTPESDLKVSVVDRPSTITTNAHYIGNRAPLAPLHFIKLPVGSIKPEGWILEYLQRQRNGLTGHLGEISAWLNKENNAWLSKDGKGEFGWEEVPYWLKGYGNLAYTLGDSAMIRETKFWMDHAIDSQRPDGFFGADIKHEANKSAKQDVWGNMLMLWCLQSYYEYSQDPRVIKLMTNYFKWEASVPDEQLLEIFWENSRGGDNLYSIYWLYNHTGEKWLLDLAHKIHRNTANWKQPNNLPNWHNVNIAQCFREPATYFMQTKDSADLKATYTDFQLVRTKYGQVPGGMFGSDENCREGYDDPRQAVETCGMVEQMCSDEMLLRISGDPFWADHCEDVAFNTYPAAVMPDFKSLRYLTAPNMVLSDSKNHSPGLQNSGPFLMMNPFSSRCCQHNHAQGWPYYVENLWMATPDNGLAAVLFNSNVVAAKVGDGTSVTLKEETNYPFEESVRFVVGTSKEVNFPLYLRIPAWCDKASLTVNGEPIKADLKPGTYARLEKTWKDGDKIELALPMSLRSRTWEKNKNSRSINYGPLTFSLKIKEENRKMDSKASAIGDSQWQKDADPEKWPSYEIFPASPWNYGLVISNQKLEEEFEIVKKNWPASNFPFTPEDVPISLKAKAKQIPAWKIDQYGLCDTLPQSPVTTTTSLETVELIPMGAARLRISAFPVVQ